MENQTVPPAPPAPPTPAVLPAHLPVQTPSAVASPKPPAAPAPSVQAAPPAPTASPTPPRTTPSVQKPAPPATTAVSVRPAVLAQHPQAAPTTKTAPAVEITNASTTGGDDHAGGPDGSEEEAAVKRHITSLWAEHENLWAGHEKKKTALTNTKASLRTTKGELKLMRAKLGKHFFELKKLLAKPGCKGDWAEFLREQVIPRATADRYAKSHQRLLVGDHGKRLTEAIPTPTEAEIRKMVVKLKLGLLRSLRTPESITQFLREMNAALQPAALAA